MFANDPFQLALQQRCQTVPGKVDLHPAHPQDLRDPRHRPALEDVEVEHLVLVRADASTQPLQGKVPDVGLPLGIPDPLQIPTVLPGCPFQFRLDLHVVQLRPVDLALPVAPAHRIQDAAPGNLEQPRLETAQPGIVAEPGHLPRHGNHGLLHHVLGGGLVEAGLPGRVKNQPPIGVEEFTPTVLLIPRPKSRQQALPGRKTAVRGSSLLHLQRIRRRPACFFNHFGPVATFLKKGPPSRRILPMTRNLLLARPGFRLPQLVVALTLSTGFAVADPASGPMADPFSTLLSLDAEQLADPSTGAHFAGTRVTSLLSAGINTYLSTPSGGETRYWAVNPAAPAIEVGQGAQNVHQETQGGIASAQGFLATFPAPAGGSVSSPIGFGATTHASADLTTGSLRSSASARLLGPGAPAPGMQGYDGIGMYGQARARAELADHLTAASPTQVRLTGTWDGLLQASPVTHDGSVIIGSDATSAADPISAYAKVVIGLWSAPELVSPPGDGGEEGTAVYQRTYLGGIELVRSVSYQQGQLGVHDSFDVTVAVPAGTFYFYASQEVLTGGQTTPWQVQGRSSVDGLAVANFDHTLQFGLTTADGSPLTSESGLFLTAVPEPGEWAAASGAVLIAWGIWQKRRTHGERPVA